MTLNRNYDNISKFESNNLNNSNNEKLYNDLFPERRGSTKKFWVEKVFRRVNKTERAKAICERNVYWSIQNSPLVKIMLAALQASGCEFNYGRHISCEPCHSTVNGGFDLDFNQIIICQNVALKKSTVQAVLVHEMIHMFDYCQNNLDFYNIKHVACSEIRAANLANCSFLSAYFYGYVSLFNIKGSHKECVKKKALSSLMATKRFSQNEALNAIDIVFTKCYNDLEPIGRRCQRNSLTMNMAFIEAPLYGYNYNI